MKHLRSLFLCSVGPILGGCAIHPLPEDVTPDTTAQIVRKIRCEARDAVESALKRHLVREEASPATRQVGYQLFSDQMDVQQFVELYDANPDIVDRATQDDILKYRDTSIGYRFSFDMTENNDSTFQGSFGKSFSRGLFTLDFAAGNKRKRQNKRVFTIADSFDDLLLRLGDERCASYANLEENWAYPITGRVGLDEVVATFLAITYEVNLGFKEDKERQFVETLTFRTEFYGSVEPKITLTPISDEFGLRNKSGQLRADRIDEHEVAVSIVLPDEAEAKLASRPKPRVAARRAEPTAGAAATKERALQNLREERFLDTQEEILQQLDALE